MICWKSYDGYGHIVSVLELMVMLEVSLVTMGVAAVCNLNG